MAVVKADAYGHGEVEAAREAARLGIKRFAVSNLEEAAGLREGGIDGEILVLGYTPPENARRIADLGITQALIDEEHASSLASRGVRIKAQFAIDTGMSRIGLDASDPAACEAVIRRYAKDFELTGMFTHLCCADAPESGQDTAFTAAQIEAFKAVASRVSDLGLESVHCMNSAGGLFCADPSVTPGPVRLGIIMYGLKPDYSNELPAGIEPCLEWKTVVAMVKTLRAGRSVGYGRTFTADRDMTVATLPVGYADGYRRSLSNRGRVLINGREAPIVGRICMDQMMVDVTDIPGVVPGTEAVLIGRSGELFYGADDMARDAETIGYEIVCDISKRVARVYTG
jgi:alanine racemase